MKRVALLLLALAACDKLPTRPDEAKFRAASSGDKCKLTAPRAMRCSDELMVAELRTMELDDGGGVANEVESGLEKDTKPTTNKQRRAMHETQCLGALDDSYVNGVFDCWSIKDCKQFAECVMKPRPSMAGSAAKPASQQH